MHCHTRQKNRQLGCNRSCSSGHLCRHAQWSSVNGLLESFQSFINHSGMEGFGGPCTVMCLKCRQKADFLNSFENDSQFILFRNHWSHNRKGDRQVCQVSAQMTTKRTTDTKKKHVLFLHGLKAVTGSGNYLAVFTQRWLQASCEKMLWGTVCLNEELALFLMSKA